MSFVRAVNDDSPDKSRAENRRTALMAAAYTLGPGASVEDVRVRASELLSWLTAR